MKDPKPVIEYEDFAKLDIRAATIVKVEQVEGAEKLIKLILDIGDGEQRQIMAGIKQWYGADDLVGKQTIVLVNLKTRKMMGEESQGMLLALDSSKSEKPVLMLPSEDVENGDIVR